MNIFSWMILAVLAVPAPAQILVEPSQLKDIHKSRSLLQERLRPVEVDGAPLHSLLRRLSEQGETTPGPEGKGSFRSFVRSVDAEPGVEERWILQVFESEEGLPDPEGSQGPAVQHLAYRRSYSDMVAIHQRIRHSRAGDQTDEWKYVLAASGAILSVEHNLVVVVRKDGELKVDEQNSRFLRMSPRDPAVLSRWGRMVRTLLTLGAVRVA
ncbi:MAG: hypothetical protein WCU88_02835 [Elusimicrobiota bacterium]|jgi:hypothetical protein